MQNYSYKVFKILVDSQVLGNRMFGIWCRKKPIYARRFNAIVVLSCTGLWVMNVWIYCRVGALAEMCTLFRFIYKKFIMTYDYLLGFVFIFRFPAAASSFILQQFSQYGNILKHVVSFHILAIDSFPHWVQSTLNPPVSSDMSEGVN